VFGGERERRARRETDEGLFEGDLILGGGHAKEPGRSGCSKTAYMIRNSQKKEIKSEGSGRKKSSSF